MLNIEEETVLTVKVKQPEPHKEIRASLYNDRSVREESSSNTGGPVARRKKTHFEDDIGEWMMPLQAESPSTDCGNSSNPAARR